MRPIDQIRRERLAEIVSREGLSVAAKRFGKPDRQINDMLAKRKSFGEKVARAMEKSYNPDAEPGWLDKSPSAVEEIPATPAQPATAPGPDDWTVEQLMAALAEKLLKEAHPADVKAAPHDLERLIEKARDPDARIQMSTTRQLLPDRRQANSGRQR